MFFRMNGEVYKRLLALDHGAWVISYDEPGAPQYITAAFLEACEKVEMPEGYRVALEQAKHLTEAEMKRLALIEPLLEDSIYIVDGKSRLAMAKKIAEENGTTRKRILGLYYKYLARLVLMEKGGRAREKDEDGRNFDWAIRKFYFSAKKMSLRDTYDHMLAARYMTPEGKLMEVVPSWYSFEHYYYRHGYSKSIKCSVSRGGLSNYQRNERPLYGSTMKWKDRVGAFQMDATEADIYLVSRFDRSVVVGRPSIYMAVDTATQLIAGIYIGLDAGEGAVMACLANAASDKVQYCKRYGIGITPEQWPNTGLPGEIITDQGKEFITSRVGELCAAYGMEREALPPFRPDEKGLVEKTFDVLQQRYKPLLRGKGVIEGDAQERWAVDYRSQAVLNLTEFTRIILHCVIYINAHRVLKNFTPTPEMCADGVEPIPAALWQWHERQGKVNLIPAGEEELYQMTLQRMATKFTRRGIVRDGLSYINNEYRRCLQEVGTDKEITVAYDPARIDAVYWVREGKYIRFPLALSSSQFKGLSQTEYEMARDKVKGQKQGLEQQDTEARVAVIKSIQAIVDAVDNTVEPEGKPKQRGADIRLNREDERSRLT
ncbi:transposase family protein [Enterocloster bolteae]|uniref:transposase family protein n=1 Tax=Enterocloster bolteae TaxID=208479 RepID=UPI00210DA469|nr:transposase family protein [Enterocloster bolteae]MCQ5145141.1 transposase family protein [Enterocloster bolteae]